MNRRRINKRQTARIQQRQSNRLQSTEENEIPAEEGLIIAQHGAHVEIEDSSGSVINVRRRQHLGALVAGDRVLWERNREGGVIVAVQPRKTLLSRPNGRGEMNPVAANVDQMLIVLAVLPAPQQTTLDRYLVAAELQNIAPVIVLNKCDLLKQAPDAPALLETLEYHRSLGYPTLLMSTLEDSLPTTFLDQLEHKTSVLVGQSGVGKSSILSKLLPHESVLVGAALEGNQQGRHTTTAARLYHSSSGDLIDSPGIRQFPLWPLTAEELAWGFIEFRPFLGQCKFKNCQHQETDLGCQLHEAVEAGHIRKERLKNHGILFKEMIPAHG